MTKVFGIDLGTTYSCIAHVDEHGKPVIVPNYENQRVTPSVVFFDESEIIVGEVAKENAKLQPEAVAAFIKRSMGDANFLFDYAGKQYRAEEISGYILRKLVHDAEQNLDEKITDVVITCPAYFGINEREATRLAGAQIAGLNVRQILNEPTAAAVAYGMLKSDENKVLLVYDLGGGTFDITMIEVKPDAIDVICTGGDHNLGGKDWDDLVVRYLVEQFQEQTGMDEDILEDPETWQSLQLSAEKAKKTLSQREKAPIAVTHGGERAKIELTREKFEELTRDLLERTITLARDMLAEARKKGYNAFDEILLVGGSIRMPQVAARVKQEFSIEPKIFDPDEAVAKGAAIYGWKLSVNDELIKRIADETGKTTEEVQQDADSGKINEEIMEKASQEVADDTGFTLAAVKRSGVKIRNVTSKSFGIVVTMTLDSGEKEAVANLVLKNTTVPIEATQTFSTLVAEQENVAIKIMENEVSEETLELNQAIEIGTAVLELPPGLPKHSPIEITFRLNEEGRLDMQAREVTDNRTVSASVETSSLIQGEELEAAKERSQNVTVS
ncbi:MAG: Hsp70 family protein [Gammaproteobacteria bacterium]|nr:Hsp70 family protein [Gammaproteobacteria bacterium]